MDPTTLEVSFRHGLGITAEGSLGVVGGSIEIETVEEHTVSLPGGTSTTLANRLVARVQAFGYEGTLGWEEEHSMQGLFHSRQEYDAGWRGLQRNNAALIREWTYTGEVPGRLGVKLGGTALFGGSVGAWIDLLGEPR